MPVFEIFPSNGTDGNFAAAWFDDDECLWTDERLGTIDRIADEWHTPRLKLWKAASASTPVLFNPNAFAVSEEVRARLLDLEEIEFLPVSIEGHGVFYVLHVLKAIELPFGATARIAPEPSGNLIEIHGFPEGFSPPEGLFRVLHPEGSAARRAHRVGKTLYAGPNGAQVIGTVARGYLEPRAK
jgi:hypothetical protein